MGDSEQNDGTDTSSLAPVSSLRSRFENLGTSNSPATPAHTPSRLSQHFTGNTPSRFSLDQPRPNFATATRREEPGTQVGRNGTGSPLDRDVPRAPRPVSMGPTSPPTTPAVMIQSPQSPPKPMFPAQIARTFGQSPPRPKSTGSGIRPARPSLDTTVSRPTATNGLSPTIGKKSKPPPPVNRANKPSLSSSPISLAPQNLVFDHASVSPFSTPPDSPTSPDSPPSRARYSRQPAPHQIQSFMHPKSIPILPPPGPARQRNVDPSDSPERRPHLPSRTPQREHARTISTPPVRQVVDQSNVTPHHSQSVRSPGARRPSPEPPTFHHSQSVRTPNRSQPPPRPSEASKDGRRPPAPQTFLPPPKRIAAVNGTNAYSASHKPTQPAPQESLPAPNGRSREISPQHHAGRMDAEAGDGSNVDGQEPAVSSSEYPDATQANRRPPINKHGVAHVWTHYDTRLFDIYGERVCSSGYMTKAWNVETGKLITDDLSVEEKDYKILSMVFKPGAGQDNEGTTVWLGSNQGQIQEVDLRYRRVADSRQAHGRNEVIKMHRFQNTIWSLDNDGRLFVWLPDESTRVPSLNVSPNSHRVAKGHTFSIIARDKLWLATGKEVRVYDPVVDHEQYFHVTKQALSQPGTGDITTGAVLPSHFDRVYFGHTDGKVSIYSTQDYTCQAVVNISTFKITAMAGVGHYIWAGFTSGSIYVYDVQNTPWKVKKEWKAHDGKAVSGIVVNRSSVWKFGHLQVASMGLDQTIRFWDGMLEDDWLETRMHEHDVEYCQFREVKTVVITWNAGASTPSDIRQDQKNSNFFREAIQPHDPPEILVFGFQELVDLEDKGLTAKNFFKGRHKKQGHDPEHMGHQYRAWRDYLTRLLEDTMPNGESYTLLQTGSLVGLFSCIFIKSSERNRIRDLEVSEVKRGMGGLYGNKGAIMIRFVLDSTSLCFTNCHLAAGQKETNARNNDATAILEAAALSLLRSPEHRMDCYVGGGDGTMVLDHEICILNGDLNYRIDTMGRDSVVKTIKAGNLERLLDRDQLLLAKRRNPGFRLRLFKEEKIAFAPTYKYDVGTDNYDSSEKNRSPAWCDRVLYRGQGRVKMIDYRRHECRASDHRPVSGTFLMRIKNVIPERRANVWERVQDELVGMKVQVTEEINADYLVNILGMDPHEAKRRLNE